jgi:hypothetical protein
LFGGLFFSLFFWKTIPLIMPILGKTGMAADAPLAMIAGHDWHSNEA